MTFFWWSGMGFLLIVSTNWLNLRVSCQHLFDMKNMRKKDLLETKPIFEFGRRIEAGVQQTHARA